MVRNWYQHTVYHHGESCLLDEDIALSAIYIKSPRTAFRIHVICQGGCCSAHLAPSRNTLPTYNKSVCALRHRRGKQDTQPAASTLAIWMDCSSMQQAQTHPCARERVFHRFYSRPSPRTRPFVGFGGRPWNARQCSFFFPACG